MISQLFSSDEQQIPEIFFMVDAGLGLIPASIAILEQNNGKKPKEFDFLNLISSLRKDSTRSILLNQNNSESPIFLENLKKPEELLIKKIKHNYIPSDFTENIFEDLKLKNEISDYQLPKNKGESVSVSRNISPDILNQNNVLTKQKFNEKIDLPNIVHTGSKYSKNRPIEDPDSTIEKFEFTPRLKEKLNHIDIFEFVITKYPQFKSNLQNYKQGFFLPLVATINNYPEQTSIYFMIHYRLKENIPLETVNADLDLCLPILLAEHPIMISELKKCRDSCKKRDPKNCFLKKLIVQIPDSSEVCVIFFVTFLSDVVFSKQKNLPLKKLYQTLKNFKILKIHMYGVVKFSLGGKK